MAPVIPNKCMNASGGLLFVPSVKAARNERFPSAYCGSTLSPSLDWGTSRLAPGTD